jgi:hypothetical protein
MLIVIDVRNLLYDGVRCRSLVSSETFFFCGRKCSVIAVVNCRMRIRQPLPGGFYGFFTSVRSLVAISLYRLSSIV